MSVEAARANLSSLARSAEASLGDVSGATTSGSFGKAWLQTIDEYGSIASEMGAAQFELWAAQQGVDSSLVAVPGVIPDQAMSRLGWATSTDALEKNVLGVLGNLVMAPYRKTIEKSAIKSHAAYARVPRGGNTCSFCAMLASRGAVYSSEVKASIGKKGKSKTGYHDDCHCVPMLITGPENYPKGYDPQKYLDLYNAGKAESGVSGALNAMRRQAYVPKPKALPKAPAKPKVLPADEAKAKYLALQKEFQSNAQPDTFDKLQAAKKEWMALQPSLSAPINSPAPKVSAPAKSAPPVAKGPLPKQAPDVDLEDLMNANYDNRRSLTAQQHVAIDAYTGDGFRSINNALRGTPIIPDKYTPHVAKYVKEIDSIFATKAGVLRDPVTVYRNRGSLQQYKVGEVIHEPGYSSTSADPNLVMMFGNGTRYRIQLPAGTKYVPGLEDEHELVLKRGSMFRVTYADGKGLVHLELIEE